MLRSTPLKHRFRSFVGAAAVFLTAVASVVVPTRASAQEVTGRCQTPDSLVIRGNENVADARIRAEAGLSVGVPLNFPTIQRAIKALYALNLFDDVQVGCDVESVPGKVFTVISLKERVILAM